MNGFEILQAVRRFEILQAVRRSHCAREGQEHECVGEVTIKPGEICLVCQLCGAGSELPADWCYKTAEKLRAVFRGAGIDWDSIDVQAKLAAVRSARRLFNAELG